MPDEDVVEFASKRFGLARDGATEQLAAYVEAGVSPDLANHKGDSPVMGAAYHGHAATVEALLAHGADPNRPNDRGQTPLAGAVFQGRARRRQGAVRALDDQPMRGSGRFG